MRKVWYRELKSAYTAPFGDVLPSRRFHHEGVFQTLSNRLLLLPGTVKSGRRTSHIEQQNTIQGTKLVRVSRSCPLISLSVRFKW
jgi:hypothetical protein